MAKASEVPSFMEQYYPSLCVLVSQLLAATLNAATKFIETSHMAVDPFMILHIRMVMTGLGCTLYLWYIGSLHPESFFGPPKLRGLLFLRALGGVCSATGFVCTICSLVLLVHVSIIYLSLSEAVALNLLSPLGALILTRCLYLTTVHWWDCIGAISTFVGVILVAQPEAIFGRTEASFDTFGSTRHIIGLVFGVFGMCGGVVTLISVRCIGIRVHPLIVVNIFAWSVVLVSGIAVAVLPQILWPTDLFTWACLTYIGGCSFVMECLLVVGISKDSSPIATLMIYTQIIWALAVDHILFRLSINALAFFGVGTVLGGLGLITVKGRTSNGLANINILDR